MRVILLIIALLGIGVSSRKLPRFPSFKQCDSRWGNDTMGDEVVTICQQGCAMVSVSMALAGFGVKIDGEDITPKTLNKWLQQNKGYHCIGTNCNNLVLDSVNKIAPKKVKSLGEPVTPFIETLKSWVENDGLSLAAHVNNHHHFVLITGVNHKENNFYVNDPNSDRTTFEYDEIADLLAYDIRY